MTPSNIKPSGALPEELTAALVESSDRQLREVIHYAQQLLSDHPPLTDAIEAREGEKLIRIDDQGAYTIVIVERPDATGEARGPFAYRVRWEPSIDEDDGRYRWHYLGRVQTDAGEV